MNEALYYNQWKMNVIDSLEISLANSYTSNIVFDESTQTNCCLKSHDSNNTVCPTL